MAYVIELNGRDVPNAAVADETLLFAFGAGIAFTDHAYVPGGALLWDSAGLRIEISATGSTKLGAITGDIEIANLSSDITEVGPLDHLLNWAFQNRVASLYYVPGNVWADRVLEGRGALFQPVDGGGVLNFALGEPRADLDAPLQTDLFAGDNVLPDGVQGGADLKGKPRAICYGTNSNITAADSKVNTDREIYNPADKACTILCVRDGAYPLEASTARGSLASLEANTPPPGEYDYYAGAEGTYIRLGSPPVKTLTFDLQEGATEADRTHAQVWSRIRTERCGTDPGDISAASITAMDTATPKEVGFYFAKGESRRQALDRVLASLSGYEVQDLTGEWSIGRLETPAGSPELSLVMVTDDPDFAMAATDRALVEAPKRAWPAYAPTGVPPYRVNAQWGLNNTEMAPEAFAADPALARLRDKFSKQWRTETATDTAIWNPADGSGAFPNAPELTVETGYQPGADGETSPHTADEAARLLALYGSLPIKGQYEAEFLPHPGDNVLPGAVIGMTYPTDGLDAGSLFIVLQSRLRVDAADATRARSTLVLGLQT